MLKYIPKLYWQDVLDEGWADVWPLGFVEQSKQFLKLL